MQIQTSWNICSSTIHTSKSIYICIHICYQYQFIQVSYLESYIYHKTIIHIIHHANHASHMLFNLLLLQLIILVHWSVLHCLNIMILTRFNRPSVSVHHKSDLRRFLCLSLRIVTRFNSGQHINNHVLGILTHSIDRQSVLFLGAMPRIVSWQPFYVQCNMHHYTCTWEFLQQYISCLIFLSYHTWCS